MKITSLALLSLASVASVGSMAEAHVEVMSGPAVANTSQKFTFAVGHGCTDAGGAKLDTIAVKIAIPAGVTSVRALTSDFGKASITTSGTDVTAITWTKPVADLQMGDFQWYELTFRARLGEVAFTKIPFVITQTCQDATGTQTVVVWDAPEGSTTGSPSPIVKVVPAHRSGWNKLTVTTAVPAANLPTYFGDAQIVWKGTAAYSPSADVSTLISATPGVSLLATDLAAGDELWVRY